ncbi:hypothetical protein BEWA_015000 [Theileria equi strain WA]|uniref:Uncharacterized protein n=1 Tax=Theileria equi strain WA TaxID=1537102 RepID=L1LC70_THEEQ|nr:hypothetical protein BEWA_015000 [Theileria equi strain WA]EKX72941.1 hypothetical protein BEWA_015000 [Theileria equi strain WA]|eukprot:XP_004832393.1 hypothetical protein BEWA_015000 [Theileria equi strain WA]
MQDLASDVLDIICKNSDVDEEMKRRGINIPELKKEPYKLLVELFELLKNQGITLNIAKLESINDFICNRLKIKEQMISSSLNSVLSKTKVRSQADILLLINDMLVNKGDDTDIPIISSVHDLYKQENISPAEALSSLKYQLYRVEVNKHLDKKLVEFAKENPPKPPPMFGSDDSFKERKKQLIDLFGNDSEYMLKFSESQIEEAAKSMLKCAWFLTFYNGEMTIQDYPSSGIDLLKLDEMVCSDIYYNIIEERINYVKEKIIHPIMGSNQKFENISCIPKYGFMTKCRYDQLRFLCRDMANWELSEADRRNRLKDKFKINVANNPVCLPQTILLIGGGKPSPREHYVNPEDDPNYFPPGASEALKMIIKIERGDEDQFSPTDEATVKKYIDIVKKELEPYEDLSAEELSKLFLKNVKQEFEFGKLVHQRKLRKKALDSQNNNDISNEMEETTENMHKNVPPKGYLVSQKQLMTDVVYFLSHYDHLIWQFELCLDTTITAIANIKNANDSFTNPKLPKLVFTGQSYQDSFSMLNEYISNKNSKSHTFRISLNESLREKDLENASKKEIDDLPLFGDDALFKESDRDLVTELVKRGSGLRIYTKMPGYNPDVPLTEHQKQTSFYRISKTQPFVQIVCSNCDYTIFSHPLISHNEHTLYNKEYDDFKQNESFKCPMCESDKDKFKQVWTTGERGYTPEPYKTLVDEDDT